MKMVWLDQRRTVERQLEIIAQNHQESSWGYWRILFNTSVLTVYDLCEWIVSLKTVPCAILEPLVIVISPYAPHIAEELWSCFEIQVLLHRCFPSFWSKTFVKVRKNIWSFNGKCVYHGFTFDLTAAQIEGIVDERRNKLIKLDAANTKQGHYCSET
jgi:leucyl-tRNA synthetase